MAKRKEKFDLEGFSASVHKKYFSPIYFFYGEETFLIDECVDAIITHGVDPSMKEFNFDVLQGSETDGKKIVSIASSYPMMAERRVIVVKEFERVSQKEFLEPYIEKPVESTILVLIGSHPDMRKKPYPSLKKHATTGEFQTQYDNETILWISSRLKKLKKSMEPSAVQLLQSLVGNSLRELSNEIEKLIIAAGEKETITVSDIEHVVGVSREFSVFELANKIGEKNLPKALEISERMLNSGENAVGMIAALTNHFVRLWKIHDALRLRKSEQEMLHYVFYNSFALKSTVKQAGNYRVDEIENAFLILTEADLALKSSGDPKLVLAKSLTEIVLGTVTKPAVA